MRDVACLNKKKREREREPNQPRVALVNCMAEGTHTVLQKGSRKNYQWILFSRNKSTELAPVSRIFSLFSVLHCSVWNPTMNFIPFEARPQIKPTSNHPQRINNQQKKNPEKNSWNENAFLVSCKSIDDTRVAMSPCEHSTFRINPRI